MWRNVGKARRRSVVAIGSGAYRRCLLATFKVSSFAPFLPTTRQATIAHVYKRVVTQDTPFFITAPSRPVANWGKHHAPMMLRWWRLTTMRIVDSRGTRRWPGVYLNRISTEIMPECGKERMDEHPARWREGERGAFRT